LARERRAHGEAGLMRQLEPRKVQVKSKHAFDQAGPNPICHALSHPLSRSSPALSPLLGLMEGRQVWFTSSIADRDSACASPWEALL